MKEKDTVVILGTKINRLTYDQVLEKIRQILVKKRRRKKNCFLIFTANVDHLMLLQKDRQFFRVYQQSNLIVPDGMPLVWASWLLGKQLPQRVNGTNLTLKIFKEANLKGWRVSFVSSNKEIIKRATLNLKKKFENLKIVEFEKSRKIDILFCCHGAPRQEKWLVKNKDNLNVSVALGIGSAVDFFAGRLKRAPEWIQNIGLEWLFRLIQEPKRLWRRYLLRDIKFPFLFLKQLLLNHCQ